MTTAVLKSSVMRHQEHWEQIAATAGHYNNFFSDPRNNITCGCFLIAEVLCQSVSFLLVHSRGCFSLYTDCRLGLQYITKNRTVWLFPGDDKIPEIMPETLQSLLISRKEIGDELPESLVGDKNVAV